MLFIPLIKQSVFVSAPQPVNDCWQARMLRLPGLGRTRTAAHASQAELSLKFHRDVLPVFVNSLQLAHSAGAIDL